MEELALNPLRRSRNKRQRSLLFEEDGDEEPLISDDDADDRTNCKNAYHRRWRNQNCSKRMFAGADPGGSLGSRDPPPEIYQGSQKNDVLV